MNSKANKTLELSVQQLIDCTNIKHQDTSTAYQNRGCSGGYLEDTLQFAKDYPVFKRHSYPYKAKEGACKHQKVYDGKKK